MNPEKPFVSDRQEPVEADYEDEDPFRDDDFEDGDDFECGRWRNGALVHQCLRAGSEECDWECPIGLPSRPSRRRSR